MHQDENQNNAVTSEGRSPKRVTANKRRRLSAKAKAEAVLRILRGESIETVSREYCVSAATLSQWRDDFIYAGTVALKSRPTDPTEARLKEAQAKIGDLTMRLEIAETYLRKKGVRLWKK